MAELRSRLLTRDAAVVAGPEAVTYLQGQLSQDVAGLEVGASAWSWVLAPAGKVDALVRVTRVGPDMLVVDTDGGWGEALVNRLTRFKLRTEAEITATTVVVNAWRGPGAGEAAANAAPGAGGRAVVALWGGEEAADVLVEASDRPALARLAAGTVAPPGAERDDPVWEAERIVAGVPAMGAELTERTIPAETGLVEVTVSFTKGCYTGQELVARIDSRGGHVARHLCLLRSPARLAVGAELTAAGKVVGTVTSAAESPATGPVALAYVARAVSPGDAIDAGGVHGGIDAGGLGVDVEALPPRSPR